MKITPKLKDTLIYMKKHALKYKLTPTLKEIMNKYNISKGAVHNRINRLVSLGYIAREHYSQSLTFTRIFKEDCQCCSMNEPCIICKPLVSENILSIMNTGKYDNWTVKEFLNNLVENS